MHRSGHRSRRARRAPLNFGHTIGHALEAISINLTNPLSHGEAISIGMVAESWLAMKLHILSEHEFSLIEQSIKAIGLPIRAQNISPNKMMKCIAHDKKNSGHILEWSIPEAIHYITNTP